MKAGTFTTIFRTRDVSISQVPVLESLRRCKKAGFESVDLSMTTLLDNNTELNGKNWEEETDRIIGEAEKLCLSMPQAHLPYRHSFTPRYADDEFEKFFGEITKRGILICEKAGIPWAVVHPATCAPDKLYSMEENLKINHELFDPVVAFANERGVGIAFENMNDRNGKRRFCAEASELKELIGSFGSARAGACWDFGHGNLKYDDPALPIRTLGPLLKAVHMADNHGEKDEHTLPYLGTIDWRAVISVLREVGYQGDFIYELGVIDHYPDALKDDAAAFAAKTAKFLLSL